MMIWSKWESHYKNLEIEPGRICRDGIVNEEEWGNSDIKVLFIMKEVNDWEGGDLKNLLKNGPKYQMWHTVARWAAGIQRGFPDFLEIDNWDSMKESTKKIASINLKKTSGGSSANMSIINAYAKMDKELLREQIFLIKPNIIIAGGTFENLIWLLDLDVDPDSPYKKPCLDKLTSAWVVPWVHPSRVNNKDTYDELKSIFNLITNEY